MRRVIIMKLWFVIACCIIGAITPALAQKQEEEKIVDTDSVTVAPAEEDNYNAAYSTSRGNFNNIILDSVQPVTVRALASDTVQLMKKKDHDFWYADQSPEEEKKQQDIDADNDFWGKLFKALGSKTANVIVWVLIILAIIAMLVFFLRNNQIGLFASSRKKVKPTQQDEIPDDIFEIDYAAAIAKAVQEGNYKLAVRLLFLELLTTLSEQRVIDYAPDKTNFDYLFQLGGSKYNSQFSNAVRIYEYVWYGNFDVTTEQFPAIQKGFNDFQRQLKP